MIFDVFYHANYPGIPIGGAEIREIGTSENCLFSENSIMRIWSDKRFRLFTRKSPKNELVGKMRKSIRKNSQNEAFKDLFIRLL